MAKLNIGTNDLATTHPALAAEWHSTKNGDLLPYQVMACSHDKAWWQCTEGHDGKQKLRADIRAMAVRIVLESWLFKGRRKIEVKPF